MIYALIYFVFCLGLFLGFWLAAVMQSAKDADELTEQFLDAEEYR